MILTAVVSAFYNGMVRHPASQVLIPALPVDFVDMGIVLVQHVPI